MDIFKSIIIHTYFDTHTLDKMTQLFYCPRSTETETTNTIYLPRNTNSPSTFSDEVAKTFIRFFYFQPQQKMRVANKYMCIHNVINNPFVSSEIQDNYIHHLSAIQRKYFVLLRFIQQCKWKRAKVQVSTDLYMNELDPLHRRTFSLLQSGRIYRFAISDIIKIVVGSVTHSSYLFPLPIRAKNPYTHEVFSKSDLYNIYFKARETLLCVPHLLELYFRCDFNIYRFKKQHSTDIFQTIVRNYVDNLEPYDFLQLFREMLYSVHMEKIIVVDADFPIQRLILATKSFVYMHLFIKYTCDRQLENNVSYELGHRLKAFIRMNPLFGRKVFKSRPKYSAVVDRKDEKDAFTFVDVKPKSSFLSSEIFLQNHLYNETDYNSYIFSGHFRVDAEDEYSRAPQNGYQPIFSDNTNRQTRRRVLRRVDDEDSDDTIITPSSESETERRTVTQLPIHFSSDEEDEQDDDDDNDNNEQSYDSSSEESVYEAVPDGLASEEEEEEEDYDW